jgi:hypothetical protein
MLNAHVSTDFFPAVIVKYTGTRVSFWTQHDIPYKLGEPPHVHAAREKCRSKLIHH